MVQWKEELEEVFEIPYYSSSSPPPELDDTSSSFDDEGSLEEIPLEPQQTSNRLGEDLPLDFGEGQRLEGFYNASFMQAGDESWDGTEQTWSSRSSGGGNNAVYTGIMAGSMLRLAAYMAPYASRFVSAGGDDPDVESDALYGAAPIWHSKDSSETTAAQPGAATSTNATSSTATSTATTSITGANTVATSFPVNVSQHATTTLHHTSPLVGTSNGSGGATTATSLATANTTGMAGTNVLSTTTTAATSHGLSTTIDAAALKNIATASALHGSGTSTAGAVTATGVSTFATANTTTGTGQGIATTAAGVANTGVRMGATKFITTTASVATPPAAPTNAIVNPILAHMAVAAGKNAASSISSGISAVTAAAPGAFGAAAGIGATAAGGITTSSSIVASTTTIAAVAAVAAGAVATAVSIPLLNKTIETSPPSSFSIAPSPVGTSLVSIGTTTFTPWQTPTATPSIFINTILPDASPPQNTFYPTMIYENPSNNPALFTWEPTESLGTNPPTLHYSDVPSQVPSSPLISVTYVPTNEVSSLLTSQQKSPIASFLPTPTDPPSISSVVPSQGTIKTPPSTTFFPTLSSQTPSSDTGVSTSYIPTGLLNASKGPLASSASPSTLEPTIVSPASASPIPSVRPSDIATGLPSSIFRQSDVPTNVTAATLQPTVAASVLQNSTRTPTSIPSDTTTLIPTASPLASVSPFGSSASPSTSEPTISVPASSSPIPTSIPSDITTGIPSIIQRSDTPTNSTGSPRQTINPSLEPSFFTLIPSDITTLVPSERASNNSFEPTAGFRTPSSSPTGITSESPVTLASDIPTYSASLPSVQAATRTPTIINSIFTQSVAPTVTESSSIPSSTPSEERIQVTDSPSQFIQSLSSIPSSSPTIGAFNNATNIPSDRTTENPTPSPSTVSALPSIRSQTALPTLAVSTIVPSGAPGSPLLVGSSTPSLSPTDFPTVLSSEAPSTKSTSVSSLLPSTFSPSIRNNSGQPSIRPSEPLILTSLAPSQSTSLRSMAPTKSNSVTPTVLPSNAPSGIVLDQPSGGPTILTNEPSLISSQTPTVATLLPSKVNPLSISPIATLTSIPISSPIQSLHPSSVPSRAPSVIPTDSPSTKLYSQSSAPAFQSQSPTQVTGNPNSPGPGTFLPTYGSSILGSDNTPNPSSKTTLFATGGPSSTINSGNPSSGPSNPIVRISMMPSNPTPQTSQPSFSSLVSPSYKPTNYPSPLTSSPTFLTDPTGTPTILSLSPSLGVIVTLQPIEIPSLSPNIVVNGIPTSSPTDSPQVLPVPTPTIEPTLMYTPQPSVAATLTPLSPIGDQTPTIEPTLQYTSQPTFFVTAVKSNLPVRSSASPTLPKPSPLITQSPVSQSPSLQPSASRSQLNETSKPSPSVKESSSPLSIQTYAPTELQSPFVTLPPSLATSLYNPGTNPPYQSSPSELPTTAPSYLFSSTYAPSPSSSKSPRTSTRTSRPSLSVLVTTGRPMYAANPTEGPIMSPFRSTNPSYQFTTVPSVPSTPPTSASTGAITLTPAAPSPIGTVTTFTPTIESTLQYTLQPSSVVTSGTEAPSIAQSRLTGEPIVAITQEPNMVPSILSSFVPVGSNPTIENTLGPSESPVVATTNRPLSTFTPTLEAPYSPAAGTTSPWSAETSRPSTTSQTDRPISTSPPSAASTDPLSAGTFVPFRSPNPTSVSTGTITSNPVVSPPDTATTEPTLQYTPPPSSFVTAISIASPSVSQSPLTDEPSIVITQGPILVPTIPPSLSVTLEKTLSPIKSPFGGTTSSPLHKQTSSPSIAEKTYFPVFTVSPSSSATAFSSRWTIAPSSLQNSSLTTGSASPVKIPPTPVAAPQTGIVTTANPTGEPTLHTPSPSSPATALSSRGTIGPSSLQSPSLTSASPVTIPPTPVAAPQTGIVTTANPTGEPTLHTASPSSSATALSSRGTIGPSSLQSPSLTSASPVTMPLTPVAEPQTGIVATTNPTGEPTLQYAPRPSNEVTEAPSLKSFPNGEPISVMTQSPFTFPSTISPSTPVSPTKFPVVGTANSPLSLIPSSSGRSNASSQLPSIPSVLLPSPAPTKTSAGALPSTPVAPPQKVVVTTSTPTVESTLQSTPQPLYSLATLLTKEPSALLSLRTEKPSIVIAKTAIPSTSIISNSTTKVSLNPSKSPVVAATNSPWSSPTFTPTSSPTEAPIRSPTNVGTGTSTSNPGDPPSQRIVTTSMPTVEATVQSTPLPSASVIFSVTEAPAISTSQPTDNPSDRRPNVVVTASPSSAATDLSSLGTFVSIDNPFPTSFPIVLETSNPSIAITQIPIVVTPIHSSSEPVVSNSATKATSTSKLPVFRQTNSPWFVETKAPTAVAWTNNPAVSPFHSPSPTFLSSLGTIVSIENVSPTSVPLGTSTSAPVIPPEVDAISTLTSTAESKGYNSIQPSTLLTPSSTVGKRTTSPSIPIVLPSISNVLNSSQTKLSDLGYIGFPMSTQPFSSSLAAVTESPSLIPITGIPHQTTSSLSLTTSTTMLQDNPGDVPSISAMPSFVPFEKLVMLPPILSNKQPMQETSSGMTKISPTLPPQVPPSPTSVSTAEPTLQPTPFINATTPLASLLSFRRRKPNTYMTQSSLRGMPSPSPSVSSTPFKISADTIDGYPSTAPLDSVIASRDSLHSPDKSSKSVAGGDELIIQLSQRQSPQEARTKFPSSQPFTSLESDLPVANLRGTAVRVLTPKVNYNVRGVASVKESSKSTKSSYLRRARLSSLASFDPLGSRRLHRMEDAIFSPIRNIFERFRLCFPLALTPSMHHVRRKVDQQRQLIE